MNELLNKNLALTRANVKHVTKIRSLETQIKELRNEILFERLNRIPLGHVQDVCLAALEEFDDMSSAFDSRRQKWNSHARIGLQAIVALEKNEKQSTPSSPRRSTQASAFTSERGKRPPVVVKPKRRAQTQFTRLSSPLVSINENQQKDVNMRLTSLK